MLTDNRQERTYIPTASKANSLRRAPISRRAHGHRPSSRPRPVSIPPIFESNHFLPRTPAQEPLFAPTRHAFSQLYTVSIPLTLRSYVVNVYSSARTAILRTHIPPCPIYWPGSQSYVYSAYCLWSFHGNNDSRMLTHVLSQCAWLRLALLNPGLSIYSYIKPPRPLPIRRRYEHAPNVAEWLIIPLLCICCPRFGSVEDAIVLNSLDITYLYRRSYPLGRFLEPIPSLSTPKRRDNPSFHGADDSCIFEAENARFSWGG